MRMERSAASGRAPKARVDGGGNGWREREDAGESESEENKTNTWIWSYLRVWGEYGGAPGDVGDVDWAPEQWPMGRRW